MAKFYGKIGFGHSLETPAGSGVWVDDIVEYPYYGDVVKNARKLDTTEHLNSDISVSNSISIVADAYAREHFFAIRYIEWAGGSVDCLRRRSTESPPPLAARGVFTMGRPRAELHEILKSLLGSDHVYFQPPPSVAMVYPCIVYNRDLSQTEYADNVPYAYTQRYQVTVIDKNPDGDIREKVAALPQTLYIRFYAADNLNHDVFNLFF